MSILQGTRIVTDGRILDGYDVVTHGKQIADVVPHDPYAAGTDLSGLYLAPGFIDIHCHGGAGYQFSDATKEAFDGAARIHAEHGTRVMYPTISACPAAELDAVLRMAEEAMTDTPLEMPGLHLEGPYLAAEMCGGQDETVIRPPDPKEYLPILEHYAPIIARWDYAPEHDPEGKFLEALNEFGIKAGIAHSAARYDEILPAYENGCRLVTHLYSCTSTITRQGGFRRLGIIETAYLLDGMDVEAISDGCHLPPELIRLIVKGKGPEHVCLITDAIRPGGLTSLDGPNRDRVPYVIEDGVAKLLDRSAFAGSIATTERLLGCTVGAGIPLADTVRMLTETPARVMGIRNKGRIAAGYDARFTLFDEELCVKNIPGL